MRFNEDYEYDYRVVEGWWIGSDEFYEHTETVFGELLYAFLNDEPLPEQVQHAVGVFMDWYKAEHHSSMVELYHEYQRELFNERRLQEML